MARLPSLNALRCFEAAARYGSFSRAANELGVTQSAVSHQIRQLEQWFGLLLFERQGRQTVPTAKGEELARALADAFDIMAAACRRLAQTDGGTNLTIAALPSVATIWLIPRLSEFFTEHPEFSARIVYAFHGHRLSFEDFDIAIMWGKGNWENCRASRLLDGSTVAVCSRIFKEKEGRIDEPTQLVERPLLHDTDRLDWQVWMRNVGLKTVEPAPGPIFEDFNLLRAAALAGQGIALCPRSLIADDLASGRLVQLFDTAIKQDWGYYILEPEDRLRQSDQVALFKSWLLSKAGDQG